MTARHRDVVTSQTRSQMDAAIWQFRSFENASLHYADEAGVPQSEGRIGLWDRVVDAGDEVSL